MKRAFLQKNNLKESSLGFFGALIIVTTIVSTVIAPFTTFATINKEINYQGKLTTPTNVAVTDGSYNMTFSLYTVSTGGSAIWSETQCYSPDNGATCNGTGTDQRVSVTSGLFSTMLGSVHSLVGIDFNQTLYLGVTVSGSGTTPTGEAEMTPRKIIGAVPAAFVADTLQGLIPASFFRADIANSTSTASTYLSVTQTGSGNIADFIGAGSTPILSILSNGNINATGTLSTTGLLSALNFTGTSTGLNSGDLTLGSATGLSLTGQALSVNGSYNIPLTASTTAWQNFLTSPSGIISAGSNLSWSGNTLNASVGVSAWTVGSGLIYNATTTDKIGIGSSTPYSTLSVSGSGVTNPFTIASSTGNVLFTVLASGYVGIGSASPQRTLDVLDASNPQLRLSQTNSSIFTDFKVAPTTGDLTISLNPVNTANNVIINQPSGTTGANLWVCQGSACPSLTISNGGNITAATAYYFGNGMRMANVDASTTAVYDTTNTIIMQFDEGTSTQ